MQAVGALGARVEGQVAMHVLVSGVAASRWGLWTFDLAVSQLLQERVPDSELSANIALLRTSPSEPASQIHCRCASRTVACRVEVPDGGSAFGICSTLCCVTPGHL